MRETAAGVRGRRKIVAVAEIERGRVKWVVVKRQEVGVSGLCGNMVNVMA